jgi:hypothetical protein
MAQPELYPVLVFDDGAQPVGLAAVDLPDPPLTEIGRYLKRAQLGAAYLRQGITDTEYVEGVVKTGLTPREALDRCLTLDALRRLP